MKAKISQNLVYICLFVLALSFGVPCVGFTQEPGQVQDEIFAEAREAFERGRVEGVIFLSPNNFARAQEFYQKALADLESGAELSVIRENLNPAMEHLERAFETAGTAHRILERLLRVRAEAIELADVEISTGLMRPEYFQGKLLTEADLRAEQSYQLPRAEEKFREAVLKIEAGDVGMARMIASELENEYRWCAIELLKEEVWIAARQRLQEAERNVPIESFRRANIEMDELGILLETKKREAFSIGELSAEIHERVREVLSSAGLEVGMAPFADLTIDELIVRPEQPRLNEEIVLTAVVRNAGRLPVEGVVVLFEVRDERELGAESVEFLEPGQVTELQIATIVQEPGEWRIAVRVDPENGIEESNEENNEIWHSFEIRPEAADVPTTPEQERSPAVEPGRMIYGTFDEASIRRWELTRGAQFIREGERYNLSVSNGAEAVWNVEPGPNYSFACRFLFERGGAKLSLQRSGERDRNQEYQLWFEQDRVSIIRAAYGEEQEIAAEDFRLSAGEWHEISIDISDGWIRLVVDFNELIKIEDPAPLPPGYQAFSSKEESPKAFFSEVRLTSWSFDQAFEIRRLLDLEAKKPKLLLRPDFPQVAPHVIPLQKATFKYVAGGPNTYTKSPHFIDPGNIPPNFVHTWILDLKDIDKFQFYFKSLDDIKLDKGDRITVYNLEGLAVKPPKPFATIKSTSTKKEMAIDISKAKYDIVKNGKKFRRIFLQLETSNVYTSRRFVLRGLENLALKKGTEEALAVFDDLNYNHAIIGEGVDKLGKKKNIPAPWKAGYHTNWNSFPLPKMGQGWFPIAKNLTDPTPNFYSLIYYNEQTSKLRLYLYNLNMPTNVSGATVTVSLVGFAQKQKGGSPYTVPVKLKGAFFPLHPNPEKWSTATVPLVEWKLGSWSCVEIPMLYPMGENIAVDKSLTSSQPANYYRSLYEEPLKKGFRGVYLQLNVESYDYGQLKGTWTGKAVGDAIQKINQSGGKSASFDLAKFASKALEAGGDIYAGAKKMHDGIKDYYNKSKKSTTDVSGMKLLGDLVSMGSSVFTGGFGVAGAAYKFISSFFGGSQTQPLQLSIELDLKGTIQGSVKIQHTYGTFSRFYLPGRFSIKEANDLGLLISNAKIIAAVAPGYDRPMGQFGYRYHPRDVGFSVVNNYEGSPVATFWMYPGLTKPAINAPDPWWDWAKLRRKDVDRLLPIIYNPFADITPIKPVVVKKDKSKGYNPYWFDYKGSGWQHNVCGLDEEYKWYFKLSWNAHIKPEPGDKALPADIVSPDDKYGSRLYIRVFHSTPAVRMISTSPTWAYHQLNPKGMLLQLTPQANCVPSTYKTFKDIKNIPIPQYFKLSLATMDEDKKGVAFDSKEPFPLDSIVYFWNIPYFYYGRTRQNAKGVVPRSLKVAHMRSPVTIDVTSLLYSNYNNKSYLKHHKIKSTLLKP